MGNGWGIVEDFAMLLWAILCCSLMLRNHEEQADAGRTTSYQHDANILLMFQQAALSDCNHATST